MTSPANPSWGDCMAAQAATIKAMNTTGVSPQQRAQMVDVAQSRERDTMRGYRGLAPVTLQDLIPHAN